MKDMTAAEKSRLAREIERQGQMRLPEMEAPNEIPRLTIAHDSRWHRVEAYHMATWTCSACAEPFTAGWRCVAGTGQGTAYCADCWRAAEEEPPLAVNHGGISRVPHSPG